MQNMRILAQQQPHAKSPSVNTIRDICEHNKNIDTNHNDNEPVTQMNLNDKNEIHVLNSRISEEEINTCSKYLKLGKQQEMAKQQNMS